MKYKDPDTEKFKEIWVKVSDTTPIGMEAEYDGTEVPSGWEEIDDPNNYSAKEIKIGTWVDGKPLYRKTISLAINKSGDNLLFAHNIQNIQDIADATCIFKRNNGDFYVINRTNPTTSTAYIGLTYIDKTNISLTIASAFSTQITNAFVTIKYTKTTDNVTDVIDN